MQVIRAFIAVNLSSEILQQLALISNQLKQKLGTELVRWSPVNNIHITLKFLGDLSLSNLDLVNNILTTKANRCPSFEISVGEVGAFPSVQRPRVIWIGVQAPNELRELQHSIETELSNLGYTAEDRPFSPHLTLARIGRNVTPADLRWVSETLKSCSVGFLGATVIEAVHLYRSDLRPHGAIYTCLFSAPLNPLESQEKLASG